MLEQESLKTIILIGLGFGGGCLFSILVLDKIYKDIMKRTIEEIHCQYCRALEIMRRQYGIEREEQTESKER